MSGGSRRRRARLGGLTLLVAVVVAVWNLWSYAGPGPAARKGEITTVVLDRGLGLNSIAGELADAGVIRSPGLFTLAARLTGAGGRLQAGEYEFASRAPLASVLADIRAGKVVRHFVTIPEGWTSEMAAEAILASEVLTGPITPPPEGSILPDTYQVQRGDSRAEVVVRMRLARDQLLDELWANRQPGLPITTPDQAVILASIVEKETALPAERPRIAAVFTNRLRAGMRLESDPTIIYGVSKGRPLGRGIRASELARKTIYNTYQIDGLPPTPIANPGREALAAVLAPPKTKELFFVADGTGGHVFANSYEEHLRNVARWRALERKKAD